MLKERISGGGWVRPCDSCRSAACSVYCRADSAYLCVGCDARVHAANRVALRHERVWVCEACERAPAAVTCKADAAALCASCDADIHAANPLSRRHRRIPILPITGHSAGSNPPSIDINADDGYGSDEVDDEEQNEAASWLLLNPGKNSNNQISNNGYVYGGEVDDYLDLVEYNSTEDQYNNEEYNQQQTYHDQYNNRKHEESDSVVPVQCVGGNENQTTLNFQLDLEFDNSKPGCNYPASVSHSVSLSSMEAGTVPETIIISDISNSNTRPTKGTIDLFSGPPLQMPTQFSPMDREARVLRYREKRKTRKFEKTIRYASRKAYAETRPRIKGRFAKRSNIEVEDDQMFSSTVMAETGYGGVPSF
ncbi:zinc finger protein CONSTANS-LIKE 2-like [Aristolochia californica]|uniref:zinc finger protein CONSTANS-LIKE 2-like n=1 Tax=Aristolochia californica TaxID=171875 RepID=UPI0035D636AB